jgi:hypothetical protein
VATKVGEAGSSPVGIKIPFFGIGKAIRIIEMVTRSVRTK